jgi:DNA-3-methyladenine glycosylase II
MPRRRPASYLHTQADLDRAVRTLARRDPRLRDILAVTGMPPLRRRDAGFAGLARIVVGQMLSTASAEAIWERVRNAHDPFHHDTVRHTSALRLRRLGLSRAKAKTLLGIAKEIRAERLDLVSLRTRSADDAHSILTNLPGVGPWTADVYLLFCLGHSDAWPAGDVALQSAVQRGLAVESRPTTKQMIALAEPWRPLRGAAAHLWWAYYRANRTTPKRAGLQARSRQPA